MGVRELSGQVHSLSSQGTFFAPVGVDRKVVTVEPSVAVRRCYAVHQHARPRWLSGVGVGVALSHAERRLWMAADPSDGWETVQLWALLAVGVLLHRSVPGQVQ